MCTSNEGKKHTKIKLHGRVSYFVIDNYYGQKSLIICTISVKRLMRVIVILTSQRAVFVRP